MEPTSTLGVKFDKAKPKWSLVPQGVMTDVVDVLTKGAMKYAPDNWMYVPEARTRYYDATLRHLTAWWEGEKHDPETGNSHLSHAICCLMFLLWFDLKGKNDARTHSPLLDGKTLEAGRDVRSGRGWCLPCDDKGCK